MKRFQLSHETRPCRFPKIFRSVSQIIPNPQRILSFGCSAGDECFAISDHFPDAKVLGVDIDDYSISQAIDNRQEKYLEKVWFSTKIPDRQYDVIFCLMVLFRNSDPLTQKEFDEAIEVLFNFIVFIEISYFLLYYFL